jgi:(p)ppGpp synthase/HD superfamily hydrolase
LRFAAEHHVEDGRVQVRKGTTIPYLSHLMIVAGYVWESGGDTNQAIAAVLHDTIEDTDVTWDDLVTYFGEDVANLVKECSDGVDDDRHRDAATWMSRKAGYIGSIPHKSDRAKLVTAADKAHNGSAIVADVVAHGPAVWERFNAHPVEIVWYYHEVLDGVAPALEGTPVRVRLQRTVEDLQALCAALEREQKVADTLTSARNLCPKCGSDAVPIIYGYPLPATMRASERGEIALGGCMPGPNNLACPNCEHRWKSPRR